MPCNYNDFASSGEFMFCMLVILYVYVMLQVVIGISGNVCNDGLYKLPSNVLLLLRAQGVRSLAEQTPLS